MTDREEDAFRDELQDGITPSKEAIVAAAAGAASPPSRLRSRLLSKRNGILALTGCLLAALAVLVGSRWKPSDPAGLFGRFPASEGNLSCVLYTPDGRWVAAGAASGRVLLWDIATRTEIPLLQMTQQPITCLAADKGDFLLAGTMSQKLLVWDLKNRKAMKVPSLTAPVTAVAAHPTRKELAIGLSDGTLVFLDTRRAQFSPAPSGHKGSVSAVAYSPDGAALVTGGTDGKLIWRNGLSRKPEETVETHAVQIACLRFASAGNLLASGDLNGEAILWSVADKKPRHRYLHGDAISGLAFTANHLATGSWDHKLRFWSIEDERVASEIDTGDCIQGMTLHPDQKTIATVSTAREVRFWKAP